MLSIERALQRQENALPGLPVLIVGALLVLVLAQSIDVSEAFQLLSATPLYGLPTIAAGALATALGFRAAQQRSATAALAYGAGQLRLVAPAFILVVLGSVLMLGPLTTNATLREYATDGETYAYLLNLAGLPRYTLPGVFEFNNVPRIVNANLWVTPFYLLLALVVALPVHRRLYRVVPLLLLALTVLALLLAEGLDITFEDARNPVATALRGDGSTVLISGLLGIAAARWDRRVPMSGRFAIAAAAALLVAEKIGSPTALNSGLFQLCLAVPVSYLTVYLCLRRLPLASIARRLLPYSLPFFLFSYPFQQLVFERGPRDGGLLINFGLSSVAAATAAAAFWHLIGRRVLSEAQRAEPSWPVENPRPPAAIGRTLRKRLVAAAPSLLIGSIIAIVFLILLAMLSLAFTPPATGI